MKILLEYKDLEAIAEKIGLEWGQMHKNFDVEVERSGMLMLVKGDVLCEYDKAGRFATQVNIDKFGIECIDSEAVHFCIESIGNVDKIESGLAEILNKA